MHSRHIGRVILQGLWVSWVGGMTAALTYRGWTLKDDRILNPGKEPYLDFAEEQRKKDFLFLPWQTSNSEYLKIFASAFPEVPLASATFTPRGAATPVKITHIKHMPAHITPNTATQFVGVGGTSAALLTLDRAIKGETVAFFNNQDAKQLQKPKAPYLPPDFIYNHPALAGLILWKQSQPALAEEKQPATPGLKAVTYNYSYVSGPLWFSRYYCVYQQLKRWVNPPRFDGVVTEAGYAPATISWGEWFKSPREWAAFAKVFWGQYLLAQAMNHNKLIAGPTNKALTTYPATLTVNLPTILGTLKKQEALVATDWHLQQIFVDPKQDGGVLEFVQQITPTQQQTYYHAFKEAYLSLGSTPILPDPYPRININVAVIQGLLYHTTLTSTLLCANNNVQIIPYASSKKVTINDDQHNALTIEMTPICITGTLQTGTLTPLNRGVNTYKYDGRAAVHMLNQAKNSLPPNADIKVVTVSSVNQNLGVDGKPIITSAKIHMDNGIIEVPQVTLKMGSGISHFDQGGANKPKKSLATANPKSKIQCCNLL